MTESTWKIPKLDTKIPGKLLDFFLPKEWEPCDRLKVSQSSVSFLIYAVDVVVADYCDCQFIIL